MKSGVFRKSIVAIVAVMMAATVCVCGCDCGRSYYDNEVDALTLSTLEVDGVFNPFFSTSGTDSTITGLTQLAMLGNDSKGNPTYGDSENVVVKDMQIIEYDDDGKVIDRSDKKNDSIETATTRYYFVLKNNVVFSNGSPLTMKDVLFNLYVYLDNFYTGASTVYSTDIVGLQEYRTGAATETEQKAFEKQFQVGATARSGALLTAINDKQYEHRNDGSINTSADLRAELEAYKASHNETYANIVSDYDKMIELFKEELEEDYSDSLDSFADTTFKDANGMVHKGLFSTDVEVFLYNEGVISWNKNDNGGNGKLYSSLVGDPSEHKTWTKEQAINAVFDVQIPDNAATVLEYWNTAVTLNDFLVKDEMEKYFKENPRTSYKNISGITFANKDKAVEVNGVTYNAPSYKADDGYTNNHAVKEGNEVLSIVINKVDPKAIWNFAFAVAPLYYYSNEEQCALADYEEHFGLESSQTFMSTVLNAPEKTGVPTGAGPYMAARASGGTDNITRGEFRANNVMYFERNEHYIGGAPKIKKVRYQVVTASNTMSTLQSHGVDFAEPNAKEEILNELKGMKKDGYEYTQIKTAGYGYIGINAGKVPDIAVRQAIMHAIRTQSCVDYYKTGATAIYRSMSTSSWAYPENAVAYYPFIGDPIPDGYNNAALVNPDYAAFVNKKGKRVGDSFTEEEQIEFLLGLVKGAGYSEGSGNAYVKGNNMLKYTFTIAGDETDHPAYSAMLKGSQLLNKAGFEIDVRTDSQALKKLSTGSLTVWAAAWGSTIDPDMYQVYHKDSTASSVKNWGYPQILMSTTKYSVENDLLEELSLLIEQARETNDQDERAELYEQALTIVMKMAVELPTYQRDDVFAYDANKIDETSFTPVADRSPYRGLMYDMHTVSLVTER